MRQRQSDSMNGCLSLTPQAAVLEAEKRHSVARREHKEELNRLADQYWEQRSASTKLAETLLQLKDEGYSMIAAVGQAGQYQLGTPLAAAADRLGAASNEARGALAAYHSLCAARDSRAAAAAAAAAGGPAREPNKHPPMAGAAAAAAGELVAAAGMQGAPAAPQAGQCRGSGAGEGDQLTGGQRQRQAGAEAGAAAAEPTPTAVNQAGNVAAQARQCMGPEEAEGGQRIAEQSQQAARAGRGAAACEPGPAAGIQGAPAAAEVQGARAAPPAAPSAPPTAAQEGQSRGHETAERVQRAGPQAAAIQGRSSSRCWSAWPCTPPTLLLLLLQP